MTRTLATILVLAALSASPSAAATKAAKPKGKPVATSTVAEVVARSGVNETMDLRDLVAFDERTSAEGFAAFAEQRAAIRACHAERYAQARDNVLTGRSAPLRDC